MAENFGLLPYNGGWAAAALTTTPQIVYECPAGKKATVAVNVENTDDQAVPKVRLARVSTVAPDAYTAPAVPDGKYLLEYKRGTSDGYPVERTGIVLGAGQALVAWADASGLVMQISGIEE